MPVLYGVGVGPGDPELITLKALRILRRVPVICVPYTRTKDGSIAGEIVTAALGGQVMREKEFLLLHFPMTREKTVLQAAWEEAARQVADRLRHMDVAFVTLGDPSFYSTYPYLERAVRRLYPEANTVVVPGVTAFSSCMATGGQSVQGNERLAVVPVAEETILEAVVKDFDCTVLLKAGRHLRKVQEITEKLGVCDTARLYERCGLEGAQQGEINRFAKADYLSLVVVKKSTNPHLCL